MIFLGDVHAKFHSLKKVLAVINSKHPNEKIIQIGDFGIGFDIPPSKLGENFRFFPGNHDDRQKCLQNPHCLGNFGYITDLRTYFISGAYSPDRASRINGYDWWEDEELTENELNLAGVGIQTLKPRIIATHDFPRCVIKELFDYDSYYSKTGTYLDAIFAKYKPEYWVGGHHHQSVQKKIAGTRFVCLPELNYFRID